MASTGDLTTSLGEFLRQERERRGITIEQVASATKISVRLLHSLEEDQYSDLPAKPFIRGFVTSYTRFIGLDPQETLTRFQSFIEDKAGDRPDDETGHSGYAFEKKGGEQTKTVLSAILGGCIVLGGLVIFIVKPAFRHSKQDPLEKLRADTAQTALASPAPVGSADPSVIASPGPEVANGSPGASPAASPLAAAQAEASPAPGSPAPVAPVGSPQAAVAQATPAASIATPQPEASSNIIASKADPLNSGLNYVPSAIKYKFVFKALEDVWVRYQIDDKPMMKFPLRKDRVLVLRGLQVVKFQVSNPKAVTYTLNGKGSKTLESDKNLVVRQNTATLVWPPQATETPTEIFPGEAALPKTADPIQPTAATNSAVTE